MHAIVGGWHRDRCSFEQDGASHCCFEGQDSNQFGAVEAGWHDLVVPDIADAGDFPNAATRPGATDDELVGQPYNFERTSFFGGLRLEASDINQAHSKFEAIWQQSRPEFDDLIKGVNV